MDKKFLTLKEAVDYLHFLNQQSDSDDDTIRDSDSQVDICQLPPDGDGQVTDLEDIDEEMLDCVIPKDVSGQVCIITNSSDDINIKKIRSTTQKHSPRNNKTPNKI